MDQQPEMSAANDGAVPAEGFVNYYEVLGIEVAASKKMIREAYLRMKHSYSRESQAFYSLMSDDEAQRALTLVDEAYRLLNDDQQRQEYDRRCGFGLGSGVARTLDSQAFSTDGLEGSVQRERLEYLRGRQAREDGEAWRDDAKLASLEQPNRKPLAPIKTTAARAAEVQQQMTEMIASSDLGDGDLYRRLRLLVGVSDGEMQLRTKVSLDYIQCMEQNRFERLPPTVYVKGFLRSYFRYLGVLDSDKLVNAYAERLDAWQTNQKS